MTQLCSMGLYQVLTRLQKSLLGCLSMWRFGRGDFQLQSIHGSSRRRPHLILVSSVRCGPGSAWKKVPSARDVIRGVAGRGNRSGLLYNSRLLCWHTIEATRHRCVVDSSLPITCVSRTPVRTGVAALVRDLMCPGLCALARVHWHYRSSTI